ARLTNDVSAVRMAAGPAIMYFVNTVVGGLFALGFMLRIDARLTGLALVPLIPLPLITLRLGGKIHERFENVQEHFGAMTTRVQENLAGTRIVRAYRQEAAEEERFAGMSDEYLRRNMHLARLQATMNPSFAFLAGLGAVIVLGLGGWAVIQGSISVGEFVAFGMYLSMLTWPLIALGWVINLFQRAGASMKRLDQIFDAKPRVTSPAQPRQLPSIRAGAGRTLEFRDVGFHYPVRGDDPLRWVFRNVSFRIKAGDTLGIVGATGSGKSALIDLVSRTYDPSEGEILLDGIPIRELGVTELRRELGVVPQESVLFSDTLRSNLAYGTTDDSDITWAADVAQLTETIADFPGGFETVIGERGINLSGGQKQRAALARALARRPSIVLLDDSLSAVDTHTEAAILQAFRDVLAGRTAVIASHRVSAIRDADWIVVLDEGRVVEEGRHEELFGRRGRYWELLARQEIEEAIA
ncbi:MAG: ABC transporter ATP-binding protein, partial [Gemmatimonadaceae bacterium]